MSEEPIILARAYPDAGRIATLEADNRDLTMQVERLTTERDQYRLGMVKQQEMVKALEAERDEWRRQLAEAEAKIERLTWQPKHSWAEDYEICRYCGCSRTSTHLPSCVAEGVK